MRCIINISMIKQRFVKSKRSRILGRLFHQDSCQIDDFLRGIEAILTRATSLQILTKRVNNYIFSNLHATKIALCIPGKGVYGREGLTRRRIINDDAQKIIEYYQKNYDFPEVMLDDIRDDYLRKLFKLHQTKLVLPLMYQGQEIGILLVGKRKHGEYSKCDVKALEYIAGELSVAIMNALSIEEIRELNENLKQKVDAATKELKESNRQLQKLDEAKNDFISMASHQLRTPLTSIKGYLDMILQGDLGEISPTQRAVLEEAFSSSERMVRLISDFLNVSRLQTGKFMIDKQTADLSQVIDEEIVLLKVVAEQRNITLLKKIDKKLPKTMMDTEKVRQVVMNMIDNAIYYSKPNSRVVVSAVKAGDFIEFTVKDSGIGVSKSEQKDIFGKFFRGTNARKKRPDGTGVGLFLARKIILSHGGEMIFLSEEGKGSTFGFRLPIIKTS